VFIVSNIDIAPVKLITSHLVASLDPLTPTPHPPAGWWRLDSRGEKVLSLQVE